MMTLLSLSVIDSSLSLRRAWIEIISSSRKCAWHPSRSPYGERGLKSAIILRFDGKRCRSPYGERGLKFRASA